MRCVGCCVVGLSVFGGCEKLVEGVDSGFSYVSEAFCRAEACKSRDVDGAWVAGRFGRGVVCSDYGGDLLEEAGAEVFWEVGGDIYVRDFGGPWALPASEEEQADRGWGVGGEGQAEFVGVGGELWWGVDGRSFEGVVVEFGGWRVVGDCFDLSVVNAEGRGGVSCRPHEV